MPSNKNGRPQVGRVVAGFMLTGTMIAAIWLVQGGAASPTANAGYPGPDDEQGQGRLESDYPTQTIGSPEELCAAAFPGRLDLSEGSEKREAEDAGYASCVEARQLPLPTPFPEPLYGITPVATQELTNMAIREAGDGRLVENGSSFLPRQAYVIINTWSLQTDDREIMVQAGGLYDEAGQPEGSSPVHGVVVVFAYTADRSQSVPEESGQYVLADNTGPVRIVDASGANLTLLAADGTVVIFDVASRVLAVAEDQSTPQREAGSGVIVESGSTTYDLPEFEFANQWYQDDGNHLTTVLAGTQDDDPWQSVLVVATANSSDPGGALTTEVYNAPVEAGRLLIMDATDSQIVLAEPAGGLFVFDLESRQFVVWPGSD